MMISKVKIVTQFLIQIPSSMKKGISTKYVNWTRNCYKIVIFDFSSQQLLQEFSRSQCYHNKDCKFCSKLLESSTILSVFCSELWPISFNTHWGKLCRSRNVKDIHQHIYVRHLYGIFIKYSNSAWWSLHSWWHWVAWISGRLPWTFHWILILWIHCKYHWYFRQYNLFKIHQGWKWEAPWAKNYLKSIQNKSGLVNAT